MTADIAATYRQTDLARQVLIDVELGLLPPAFECSDKPLAEEMLRFAAGSGATDIVRLALQRIDCMREDSRLGRIASIAALVLA